MVTSDLDQTVQLLDREGGEDRAQVLHGPAQALIRLASLTRASLAPQFASAHGVIGRAFLSEGRFVDAKAAADEFLRGLAKVDPNTAQQEVQQDARILELNEHLPDVLSGKEHPDPHALFDVATICIWPQRISVRLFRIRAASRY
jgi:hypothetical protein